eukprot:3481037-Pyramimonas_sp.AAC.1
MGGASKQPRRSRTRQRAIHSHWQHDHLIAPRRLRGMVTYCVANNSVDLDIAIYFASARLQ